MALVFNATKTGLLQRSLSLTSGTFYMHLVTTAPTDPTFTTVSQLTLAAGGNYQPFIFTGTPALAIASNRGRVTYNQTPIWPLLTTNGAASIKGSVFCKQAGPTPDPNDLILSYSALPLAFSPNTANLELSIPTTGLLDLFASPGLTFNQALLGLLDRSIDLTSGTFYMHLVTTAPTDPTFTTVSQLTLATGGNYSPVTLQNLQFLTDVNAALWTADDPIWSNLTTNNVATIKGGVVCKRLGGSPVSTDPIICYKPLEPSQFPSGYTTNGANFKALLTANGVLRLP